MKKLSAPKTGKGLPSPAMPETALAAPKNSGITRTGPGQFEVKGSKSLDEMLNNLSAATGSEIDEVNIRLLHQIMASLVWPTPSDIDVGLAQAISTIGELKPRNLTEGMLAAQMIATHDASAMFLQRAT